MNEKEYDEKIEYIEKENTELLEVFKAEISDLSKKMIKIHLNNVNFYINEFLPYRDFDTKGPYTAGEGVNYIQEFILYECIEKYIITSKDAVNNMCASLKKFYEFMYDENKITKEQLKKVKFTIKDNREIWLDEMDDVKKHGSLYERYY